MYVNDNDVYRLMRYITFKIIPIQLYGNKNRLVLL